MESPAGVFGAGAITFLEASTRSSVFIEESAVAYLSAMISSFEGSWLVAEESVLEEGALSAPGGEVLDGLNLVYPLAGVAELGPPREVVAGRLAGPLDA